MALIDDKATVEIEIGDNSYTLRRFLGFYAAAQIQSASFAFQLPKDWDGKDEARVQATPNVAQRKLARLGAYLVSWSHEESLTEENIKRLPVADANGLLDRIRELEGEQPEPFRGESATKKMD